MTRKSTALYALVIPSAVVLLDQGTKRLADLFIPHYDRVQVLPFLNLVYVRNEGAAFGLFKGLGNWFFISVSIVAVAAILFMIIKGKEHRFSFALVLGGAVGNMIDRLALGYVRDFVDMHAWGFHWPAFNVADSCLTVGLLSIIIGTFIDMRRDRQNISKGDVKSGST